MINDNVVAGYRVAVLLIAAVAAASASGAGCPMCTPSQCTTLTCARGEYACLEGPSKGGCSPKPDFWPANHCPNCCNIHGCVKPCPPCNATVCHKPPCGYYAPYVCTSGKSSGACGGNKTWGWNPTCQSCCDLTHCLPPPPSPTPTLPKNPWDLVPPTNNCTFQGNPFLGPDPKATPWGGMDVSALGCKASVSPSCCGYTPRFNWILSTCHKDKKKRTSMACTHTGANNTAMDIYYISAYQWNHTHWVKDPTSSVAAKKPGEFVNFDDMYLGGGWPQDWDEKYGPTTPKQKTQGLGPPGMMVVVSAKQFSWSAFYMLNQITLNRGPGGEHYKDNCWSSSSGEFDFIEPPFWGGVRIPLNRYYLTITADAGRCFPVQKNIPREFSTQCSNQYCCEMCSCPNGTVCFGDTTHIGFTPMGCILPNMTRKGIPPGDSIFLVNMSMTSCGEHFGGVAGGSGSNAWFDTSSEGDKEVLYAAVLDRRGVTVYRYYTDVEGFESKWPGLAKYGSSDVLPTAHPNGFSAKPPCKQGQPCAIHEPSCEKDCPLLAASGTFGLDQLSGAYAAESARDGYNWWDKFDDTKQVEGMTAAQLPKYEYVVHFTPPLPYYCNKSCGFDHCHSALRCPFNLPYMCTGGDGINGCANTSQFWPLSPHCNSCCDVRLCPVITCGACNTTLCNEQMCPNVAPYMCTSGPSVGGCSPKSSFWPEAPGCDSCCNYLDCPQNSARKAKKVRRKALPATSTLDVVHTAVKERVHAHTANIGWVTAAVIGALALAAWKMGQILVAPAPYRMQ